MKNSGWLFGTAALGLFAHLWWRSADVSGWGGPYVADLAGTAALVSNFVALALYFAAHSYFASERFKTRLRLSAERRRRLFLWLNFALTFLLWVYWAPLRQPLVWQVDAPLSFVFYGIQGLGLAGIIWTYLHFDLGAFFGASREEQDLAIAGPFALCRHPSYFFGLLLLASPYMPLGRFVLVAGVSAYIAIGSRIEEGKLLSQFGARYARYRAATPWLIPSLASVRRCLKSRS